jgi:hypothetical protein
MADIAKSGTPTISTLGPDPGSCKLPTLYAGEAIAAGDACYVKSDGLVWRSTGAAATAPAKVAGYAPMACGVGDAITLFFHVCFRYGAGLTPGATLFLSATAGAIADAATTGGTAPIGFVVDATRVYLYQSRY